MKIYFTVPDAVINIVGKDLAGLHTDIDEVRLTPEAKTIYNGIKKFIEQRLMVLKEQIDNEETENKDAYTLMNFSDKPMVQYLGYSHILTSKMEDSITDEDWVFIKRVLTGEIQL